jgi:hypothetical protein
MAGEFYLIKSASATDVASLDITDCFNSTYNLYEVIYYAKRASGSSATNSSMRFLDSTGSAITSNYHVGYFRWDRYEAREYSTTYGSINSSQLQATDRANACRMSIANPYADDRYTTGYSSRYMYTDNIGGASRGRAYFGLNGLKDVQRITGLQILGTSGNLDIDISVYGYGEG